MRLKTHLQTEFYNVWNNAVEWHCFWRMVTHCQLNTSHFSDWPLCSLNIGTGHQKNSHMGRPLACTRVCDKKAWFGQHDVTLPILLLVSRCGLDSYTASVVSSKGKESSVCFCDAYSTQNRANKQHGVKCYFRLIWCETHAAPAVVRSIHIKHGEEYIYSHSALPRRA